MAQSQNESSPATILGMFTALLIGEVGAAVAIMGGLWTAFRCLSHTDRISPSEQWKFFLIAGCLFVAILAICRWTRRT